jgi:hypothetical protein
MRLQGEAAVQLSAANTALVLDVISHRGVVTCGFDVVEAVVQVLVKSVLVPHKHLDGMLLVQVLQTAHRIIVRHRPEASCSYISLCSLNDRSIFSCISSRQMMVDGEGGRQE